MAKIDKNNLGYLGFDYQVRLIAQILTDRKFGESIIDIVDANYFEDQYLRIIVATIKDAKKNDDIIPDVESLRFRLLDGVSDDVLRKYVISQLNNIKKADLNDTFKVQDIAMKFCKQQELKKSIKEINKIIDKGVLDEYEKCENILRKALEHGDNKDDGIDVCENIDAVLADDFRNPIATGIKGLDEIMDGGLSKGELAVILAALGVGKAQPLTSKILTPNGWTTMGEINVGDDVISRDGNPTKVLGVYPQGVRPIYRISFNDGTHTLCDEEHLWSVNSINKRHRTTKKNGKNVTLPPDNSYSVIKTIDMVDNLTFGKNKQLNYKIPNVEPVNFTKKNVIINPYVLGVLLGDGCISKTNQPNFVTKDLDIIENVKNRLEKEIKITELFRNIEKEENGELVLVKRSLFKVSIKNIKPELINLGLYGCKSDTKFIPSEYLINDVKGRVELLQGLVDTDGYIDGHRIEISTVSEQLSNDIKELVLSLGGRVSISKKQGSYKKNGVKIITKNYYRISFSLPNNGIKPALCNRKINKFNPRTKYSNNKFIKSIEYSHDEEAKCIMVDNPEHLYVTDDYIVTHNTTALTKIANTAKNLGYNVLQIFFEDMPMVIQRKHLACWSGYNLSDLNLHKDELKVLAKTKDEEPGKLKLKKFSSHGTTIPMIRQYIRKLIAQGFRPDIVLLDYIDCVIPSKHHDDINAGEGSVMREFEAMLGELNLAGWTAIQGNRSSIKSEVVEADQMGGSIKKAQIGHFIMSIARTLDQKDNGTATMAILKSRFGRDGMIYQNIRFDNGRIIIDMGENKTGKSHTEVKKETEANQQQRLNALLDAKKSRENTLNTETV